MLDNNYNLFNNEMVDEITSTFLSNFPLKNNYLERVIIDLIEHYNLKPLCGDISFENVTNCFGLYNYQTKKILINSKLLIDNLSKINSNEYFIKANIYRIILHEIKHILQHKMVLYKDNRFYKIFKMEFDVSNMINLKPSEINADIDSSLTILKNFNRSFLTYQNQFIYTIRTILSYYLHTQSVLDYCKENDICIDDIDMIDRVLYGLDNNFKSLKLIIKNYNLYEPINYAKTNF